MISSVLESMTAGMANTTMKAVTTSDLAVTPVPASSSASSGNAGAQPAGAEHLPANLHPSQSADPAAGTGTDGEEDIWTGRYSMRSALSVACSTSSTVCG